MRLLLTSGAFLGALAVMFGAFGAHALKAKLTIDQLASFDTAVRYQFYHVVAIIAVVLISKSFNINLNISGYLFLIGILLFSGSIYLLACKDLLGIAGFSKVLGPITPLGGLCFIMGWIYIAVKLIKSNI